ncbi:MAG: hypothetical protein CL928_00710 [Deltaproteobacteria bacterium]|nr:hypothetical protein [Deltaproteobacteria bacterium]
MKTSALLTLSSLFLLLAGCGDSGSTSAPQASAPSPAAPAAAPAAKAGYQAMATVADAGTLSGTVSYAGDKTDANVTITKDKTACVLHGGKDERPADALIATDGKLKNVVVWLDGVQSGKAWDIDTIEIDNKDCKFVPHVSIGKVGGMLAAKNSDPVLHNTHLFLKQGNKNLVNIALPQQGQVIEKKLKKKGIVDVKCDAHEWMQAYIFVADNPYAAVTGDDGSFTMADVPAGEYTLKMWHETLGSHETTVTVTAGGATTADADAATFSS